VEVYKKGPQVLCLFCLIILWHFIKESVRLMATTGKKPFTKPFSVTALPAQLPRYSPLGLDD